LLGQAAWAREKLRAFAGQCVRVEWSPPVFAAVSAVSVIFEIAPDGLLAAPMAGVDSVAAVSIVLPPDAPLLVLRGQDMLLRETRISGSAEFAETLGYVLRHLRWDVEEDLARVVGDIAAHRLVGGITAFAAWQRDKMIALAENLGEYLTEERPAIVRRPAIRNGEESVVGSTALLRSGFISADFAAAVTATRADVERLEQRLRRLGG
jgi:ubiquinone biosynthesis protein UbiJ